MSLNGSTDVADGRLWPNATPVEPLSDGRRRGRPPLRHRALLEGNSSFYGVLDKRLGEAEFVGGELSIGDFAILGWAWRHVRHQIDLAHFPNVGRWYQMMMARPGVQRGFSVALS